MYDRTLEKADVWRVGPGLLGGCGVFLRSLGADFCFVLILRFSHACTSCWVSWDMHGASACKYLGHSWVGEQPLALALRLRLVLYG